CVLAGEERSYLAQAGAFNREIHVGTAGIGVPASAEAERAESLRGTIGTCGTAFQRDFPIAAGSGGEIEIGLGEIEDAFGIAEFEVNASVAHMDLRSAANHCGVNQ